MANIDANTDRGYITTGNTVLQLYLGLGSKYGWREITSNNLHTSEQKADR